MIHPNPAADRLPNRDALASHPALETETLSRFAPPLRGAANPGTANAATTPGSFANPPDLGGPLSFSSPDTPGMPAPSAKTAWDFLPEGWSSVVLAEAPTGETCASCCGEAKSVVEFRSARGEWRRVVYPQGFTPITQLE